MKNNWDVGYYRMIRSVDKRNAYIRHLLDLGYTKGTGASGGVCMYPPADRLLKQAKKLQEVSQEITERVNWLPYKDD